MAYTFQPKSTATVKAKVSGTTDSVSIQGTNPNVDSADNAALAINKLLGVAYTDEGKQVQAAGMTRTKFEEAVSDGE